MAPNLFLATLRDLDENANSRFAPITPELQLGSPQQTTSTSVIEEGMELLPQIREGLSLLEAQQSRLLRAYQGLRNHIREVLEKYDFDTQEIRVLLLVIENDGEMSTEQLVEALNVEPTDITSLVNPLILKNILISEQFAKPDGTIGFRFKIASS